MRGLRWMVCSGRPRCGSHHPLLQRRRRSHLQPPGAVPAVQCPQEGPSNVGPDRPKTPRPGHRLRGKVTKIVEKVEAERNKEAEAAAPDALKAVLAEAGLDHDEATPLLVAAVKAMADHKAAEAAGGK